MGTAITITVSFGDMVMVTGTPQLALNAGSGVAAKYVSGSGTSTLTFTYTVVAGQHCSDLDYISTGALTLSGGTVEDAAGLAANLVLPALGTDGLAARHIVINTTPPAVSAYRAQGVTTAGETRETFTVTYADSMGVNVSTLDCSDVRATGPNGYSQLATYLSVNSKSNGTPRTATYQIPAPDGKWDSTDNGTYCLTVQAGQVGDNCGNYMSASTFGSFTVNIKDTTPPTPNPSTWATKPYAVSGTAISMTATTASDLNGVQYYFHCLTAGGHDSGWQASSTYQDTGLSPKTSYTYEVKTRDNSPKQNQGSYSASASATTLQVVDTTPPTPNPSTWAVFPHETGTATISMTANTATDPSGVLYYFACLTAGGHNSNWQTSPTYQDKGLSPGNTYTYEVRTRDQSSNQNMGSYSSAQSATTLRTAVATAQPVQTSNVDVPVATASPALVATVDTSKNPQTASVTDLALTQFNAASARGAGSSNSATVTLQPTGKTSAVKTAVDLAIRELTGSLGS